MQIADFRVFTDNNANSEGLMQMNISHYFRVDIESPSASDRQVRSQSPSKDMAGSSFKT